MIVKEKVVTNVAYLIFINNFLFEFFLEIL